MNGLKQDGLALAKAVADKYAGVQNPSFDVLIAPPFTILDAVSAAAGKGIWVAGQDCSSFESGAHTGDISPLMIKDLGCHSVIVGHSERRTDHKETDAAVKAKATAALKAGLDVIVCIGETLDERNNGKTLDVVGSQIKGSMPDETIPGKVVIAYEPVWAIGTGKTPTSDDVQEVHAFIRGEVSKLFGADTAAKIQILYGGSVKPSNAAELLGLADVDGALIGGASLKIEDFWGIASTQL